MTSLQVKEGSRQLLFLPKHLTKFSMPLRAVATTDWVKVNGDVEYSIAAGRIYDVKTQESRTCLPSGKIARAIMMWVCTQAKLSGRQTVEIAPTMRGFLKEIGIPWSSQNAAEATNQIQALTRCMFTISSLEEIGDEKKLTHSSFLIAEESKLWMIGADISETQASEITLSPTLFQQLEDAVPIDAKTYGDLLKCHKSPLVLDIYAWLCLRLYKRNGISRVSWNQLHEQFGSSGDLKHFKQTFREALATVLESYPGARIEEQNTGKRRKGFRGFIIYPAPRALSIAS